MEYSALKTEQQGKVMILTLCRPEALNALNTRVFDELNHFLDVLAGNSGIRVLIITGDGKAFVAGADIKEMQAQDKQQAFKFSQYGQQTFDRFGKLDIPVIAAVNGFALGGGLELAMACDFRMASNKAKFGQPEMTLGLIPGYAGTQRLSRLCGLGNALYLILTAEMITADEALRIGLVQKVTEPEVLMEECMKLAVKMADNGSFAVPKAKKTIREGYCMNFDKAKELESNEFAGLFVEPTTKEGMLAFVEKRKPNW